MRYTPRKVASVGVSAALLLGGIGVPTKAVYTQGRNVPVGTSVEEALHIFDGRSGEVGCVSISYAVCTKYVGTNGQLIEEVHTATTNYTTPGSHSFSVPTGVTSITVDVRGGGGGGGSGGVFSAGARGGSGGRTQCTLTVTPSESLTVLVGGGGGGGVYNSAGGAGGTTGGGAGGNGGAFPKGGGGGGRSEILRGATRLVVAGGGGGGGSGSNISEGPPVTGGYGGDGGGSNATQSQDYPGWAGEGQPGVNGTGGTGSVGGGSGSSTDGGSGGTAASGGNGGGGGGGYGGGSGGGADATPGFPMHGGGGGDGFADAGATGITYTTGGGGTYGTGGNTTPTNGTAGTNGQVSITYNQAPPTPGVFTEPDLGVSYDASISVAWGSSVDPDGDAVTYDLDIWDGSVWSDVASPGTNSYTHNTSGLAAGSNYKYRVRAYDGALFSAYRESDTFTIQHDVAPNTPTGLAQTSVQTDTTPSFECVVTDNNDGQQVKARFKLYENDETTLIGTVDSAFAAEGGTFSAEWVSTLSAGTYKVKAQAIDDTALTSSDSAFVPFYIKVTVSDDLTTLWDVYGSVSKDLDVRWNVQVNNVVDLEILWDVFQSAIIDLELKWGIKTPWVNVDDPTGTVWVGDL